MRAFKGLLCKEWMQSRWTYITFLVVYLAIAATVYAPVLKNPRLDAGSEIADMVDFWFMLHLFFGVVVFLSSINQEFIHPDLWLHSKESLARLTGAKAVMAATGVLISLVALGILTGIVYYMAPGEEKVAISTALRLGTGAIIMTLLSALFVMMASFVVWAFYRLVASRTASRFAGYAVTIGFLLLLIVGWSYVNFSGVLQAVREAGPVLIGNPASGEVAYMEFRHLVFNVLAPSKAMLTGGSLLLAGLLIVIGYAAGVFLLDKKVRYGR